MILQARVMNPVEPDNGGPSARHFVSMLAVAGKPAVCAHGFAPWKPAW